MTAYRSCATTSGPLQSALRCALLLGTLTLAACSLPKAREGEMRLHTLQLSLPASAQPALGRQLLVELPTAAAPINSDRVAVRVGESEYGVLRGLRWSEPAPQLWQSLLVRAIEDDGRLSAGRDRDSLFGDERLLGELRAFEYLRDSGHVRIHYHAKRVDAAQRVVASRSFTAEVAVGSSEPAAVIAGFHAAARQLVPALLEWLTTH
ncbi:ABC-type transport auxiliary lipoprotein family protein [Aquimonas sp.]|jgi:cholesterol transport system auxiliary component|uniref:ABC-type transport auxiliary lipoprotein family protein n=1 Tax=Aquimonas sp. TaxID=1872588 RepID=UPI0037C0DF82